MIVDACFIRLSNYQNMCIMLEIQLVCMTLWMRALFAYQNLYMMLEIQLLHSNLDFIMLKFIEGVAALGCFSLSVLVGTEW